MVMVATTTVGTWRTNRALPSLANPSGASLAHRSPGPGDAETLLCHTAQDLPVAAAQGILCRGRKDVPFVRVQLPKVQLIPAPGTRHRVQQVSTGQ